MAINWILALKAVPWTDVVQAAPHIVKGARKLFTSVRGAAGDTSATLDAGSNASSSTSHSGVVPRLSAVETAIESLRAEQYASVELIRSLAEHNAKVVAAMEVLRARTRVLFAICAVLAVAIVTITAWALTR